MAFSRTLSGLNNQYLFYNVDAVIYVEGGKQSRNKSDVYAGNHNDESIDIIFWRNLFRKFRNDLNLKFKAVGSKNTVSSIALDISRNDLSNVIAAMDSEFDQVFKKQIQHKNVIYTKGYSWENDTWNSDIFISIIQDVSGEEIDKLLIETAMDKFLKKVKIGVYADGYLFKKGDSFFPRKGHMKCVCCDLSKVPDIEKPYIETELTNKGLNKSTLYSFGSRYKIKPEDQCFGHLLGDFCFHLMRYVTQIILGIKALHKEHCERLAISKFMNLMSADYQNYYNNELQKCCT